MAIEIRCNSSGNDETDDRTDEICGSGPLRHRDQISTGYFHPCAAKSYVIRHAGRSPAGKATISRFLIVPSVRGRGYLLCRSRLLPGFDFSAVSGCVSTTSAEGKSSFEARAIGDVNSSRRNQSASET